MIAAGIGTILFNFSGLLELVDGISVRSARSFWGGGGNSPLIRFSDIAEMANLWLSAWTSRGVGSP